MENQSCQARFPHHPAADHCGRPVNAANASPLEGDLNMTRCVSLAIIAGILGFCLATNLAIAETVEKGKTCRMEQQCKWVNFKKICTWVKVCR
jgi:hypothetical protein